jgi:hypothetical protein
MDELFKQLLLPLLGGFICIWVNHRLRFLFLPGSGEKFFLMCGVLGAFGLSGGTVLAEIARELLADTGAVSVWRKWSPYSFAQVLAFVGLPALGWLLNFFWPKPKAFNEAIKMVGDTMEILFAQAVTGEKMVLLSLLSGRIYVGKIEETSRPLNGRRHVRIVPFLSGFRWPIESGRNDEKCPANRVHWSTVYRGAVEVILEGKTKVTAPSMADKNDMGVVISVDEIETATLFHPTVYTYLNRDRYPKAWERLQERQAANPAAENSG